MTRSILQIVALLAAAGIGYQATSQEKWYWSGEWTAKFLPYVDGMLSTMPEGCRYLSEANVFNYYTNDFNPFIIYSKYSRPLFEAEDPESIERLFKDWNICSSVTIKSSYFEWMGPETPLMRFFTDDKYTIEANSRYYDSGGYYRWAVFRHAFRGVPRLVISGVGPRLVWRPKESAEWTGKVVTVGYFMRSKTPDRFAGVVSDGVTTSAAENHPGDGKWRWGYVSHVVSAEHQGIEVSFGPTGETVTSDLLEIANVVVTVDGERTVDGLEGFDAWQPGRPLPPGWFLEGEVPSLFVSKLR